MIKRTAYMLLFTLALALPAHALTVTSDIDTDLGDIASGSEITFNLTASSDEAEKPSDIFWQIKSAGSNPGLRLDKRRGDTVKLSASPLNRTGRDGKFSITVSANDKTSTGTITITGRVVNKPVIRTEALGNAQAGGERKYVQRLEFNPGSEPLELTMTGNVPEGLEFGESNAGGRKHHVITGTITAPGTYTFTLKAENTVGTDSKELTLKADPTAPKIRVPKDFPKEYLVYAGKPFYIDLNTIRFIGSSPLNINIDDKSKELGLEYDSTKKMITGAIPEGTKARRHNIVLRSSNPYGKTASTVIKLNINSIGVGFRLVPTNSKILHVVENSRDIYVVPVFQDRAYYTQFKTDTGTPPITWDYEITGMDEDINGKMIVKDLGGKFRGLEFGTDGSISGTPEKGGNIIVIAEASNSAGVSRSEIYDFTFGMPPAFSTDKTAETINLIAGRNTGISLADYLMPSSNGRFTETFTAAGDFPPGMSFDGERIKGIPMALDPSHLKQYIINITATNAFGTAYSRLILDLQEVPGIGDIPDTVNGRAGHNFSFTLPTTNAKVPHTWRLVYQNEDVVDEVGDSGIEWDAEKGRLSGIGRAVLEGQYTVTAYLTSEFGEDSKTFTIDIKK